MHRFQGRCRLFNSPYPGLLGSNGLACQEDEGYADDGVELGEDGEHQGVTEHLVALGHGGDAVGADLTLTDAREEAGEAAGDAGTEHGAGLDGGDFGGEQAEDVLAEEESGEAVQTLGAGHGREGESVTEYLGVLLQSSDGGVAGDCYSVGAADARQSYHDCDAQIGD